MLDILQTKNTFNISNLLDITASPSSPETCSRPLTFTCIWAKSSHITYLIMECLIFHVIYSILNWKWKTGMSVWVQNGCKCIGSLPSRSVAHWPSPLLSITRGPSRVSLAQEKIQIQNFKYGFYWMCPAFTPPRSQKVMTLNHCRLGAVCTLLLSNVEKDIL